jgi:hypothetical protein
VADSDILRGAQQRAAGETLGLTQDQVLALKRQQAREAQRENRGRRAERAGNEGAAREFLAEDTRRFESKGRFVEQERYADPFGIPVSAADPEPFSQEELREMNRADFQRERGEYVIVDQGRGKERMWRERGQLVSDPKFAKNKKVDMADPFVKPPTAPQGAGFGGPNGLATQLADMVLRGEVDPTSIVPGTAPRSDIETRRVSGNERAQTIQNLIDSMGQQADPQLINEADTAVGRQTAQRDAERFTPAARALVNERAEREALGYIANTAGYTGDINTIQTLGLASKKFNRGVPMDQFNVVQAVDPNTFTDAIEMIGPNGETVGYNDGSDRFIADANFDAGSTANSPVSKTATWMEGNLPSFGREGGANFGPRSINPGDELSMLSQRLGQFAPATGIRGIDDLEQAVRAVTVDAAFSGRTMWNYNPETGTKIAVQDPGIDEVLAGLDYTPDEKTRLAAALQSVEAAQLSPVNRLQKEMYAAGLTPQANSNVATGYEKDVQLARITNERVGRDNKKTGEKRTSVRKGLRELDASPARVFQDRDPSTIYTTAEDGSRVMLPEAQQDLTDAIAAQGDSNKPFQAAPQGSKPERAQFLSRRAVNMTPSDRIKAYGPEGGAIANRLEVVRDEIAARQANNTQTDSPMAKEFRRRDAQFGAAGAERVRADEARARSVRGLPGVRGDGQAVMGSKGLQYVPDSIPYGSQSRPINSQQATSAVTNPAPDPTPLTDRGGWMGGSGGGRVVSPWSAGEPDPQGGRRITDDIKNELAALNSGATQGPRTPGIRQKIMNSIKRSPTNFRAAPRAQRYGAVAGGALLGAAGLSGLIGGERDRRMTPEEAKALAMEAQY